MYKLFTDANPMIRFLTKVCDVILLNIIFVITCLPVFTIGAALPSLYYCAMHIITDKTNTIFRSYLGEFKKNFKNGLVLWIITILTCCVLAGIYMVLGGLGMVGLAIFAVLAFVAAMVIVMMYPLQGIFENTIPEIIKNSLFLSLSNFPTSFSMVIIPLMLGLISLKSIDVFGQALMLWLLLGFAFVAVVQMYLLRTALKKKNLLPEKEEEDDDFWTVRRSDNLDEVHVNDQY